MRHVFMAYSKLEARGHLLHKTGTPPKHFSRECTYLVWALITAWKHTERNRQETEKCSYYGFMKFGDSSTERNPLKK